MVFFGLRISICPDPQVPITPRKIARTRSAPRAAALRVSSHRVLYRRGGGRLEIGGGRVLAGPRGTRGRTRDPSHPGLGTGRPVGPPVPYPGLTCHVYLRILTPITCALLLCHQPSTASAPHPPARHPHSSTRTASITPTGPPRTASLLISVSRDALPCYRPAPRRLRPAFPRHPLSSTGTAFTSITRPVRLARHP